MAMGTSRFSTMSRHRVQRIFQILPWISESCRDPASRCSPSTFCVMSQNRSNRCSIEATASCAGFGRLVAMSSRRQLYHSQTSRGSRAKASGVARSSARYCRHSPSAPRNVGTPLSAEIPAPVSTVTDRAVESLCRTRPSVDPVPMKVGRPVWSLFQVRGCML